MITPHEEYPDLATSLRLDSLYFKREDLHPYGSHKGRSIPQMIDHYFGKGDRSFAISSSGNAALAAALHFAKHKDVFKEASLDIFVGNKIKATKLASLVKAVEKAGSNVRLLSKERPLQALHQAIEEGARSLRQSTDDEALAGYESLAQELSQIDDAGAVFMGSSSGTTAQALAQYFLKNKIPIQVHIVQTSSCHPLSQEFENYDGPQETSLAEAISDLTAKRKEALLPLIKKTGGYGWIATNEEIETAMGLVEDHTGLKISANSALSVAGLMQAIYRDHEIKGKIICLITGQ